MRKHVSAVLNAITGASGVVSLDWALSQLAATGVKSWVRTNLIAAFRDAAADVYLQQEILASTRSARRSAKRHAGIARATKIDALSNVSVPTQRGWEALNAALDAYILASYRGASELPADERALRAAALLKVMARVDTAATHLYLALRFPSPPLGGSAFAGALGAIFGATLDVLPQASHKEVPARSVLAAVGSLVPSAEDLSIPGPPTRLLFEEMRLAFAGLRAAARNIVDSLGLEFGAHDALTKALEEVPLLERRLRGDVTHEIWRDVLSGCSRIHHALRDAEFSRVPLNHATARIGEFGTH
ncbi:MAG: hypothetical protein ACKVPX_06750 [Myxococcaceae bacterium]